MTLSFFYLLWKDDTIRLRPHHLLCTQSFAGKGYNAAFTANMTAITDTLRNDASASVDIVFSTDDVCECCPNMLGVNLCVDNDKVNRLDRKVVECFNIVEKRYVYADIVGEVNRLINDGILDDICGECSWYRDSGCKKIILLRKGRGAPPPRQITTP